MSWLQGQVLTCSAVLWVPAQLFFGVPFLLYIIPRVFQAMKTWQKHRCGADVNLTCGTRYSPFCLVCVLMPGVLAWMTCLPGYSVGSCFMFDWQLADCLSGSNLRCWFEVSCLYFWHWLFCFSRGLVVRIGLFAIICSMYSCFVSACLEFDLGCLPLQSGFYHSCIGCLSLDWVGSLLCISWIWFL